MHFYDLSQMALTMSQVPDADVVITHDDEWCALLEEVYIHVHHCSAF
jgi:hypothetical protein